MPRPSSLHLVVGTVVGVPLLSVFYFAADRAVDALACFCSGAVAAAAGVLAGFGASIVFQHAVGLYQRFNNDYDAPFFGLVLLAGGGFGVIGGGLAAALIMVSNGQSVMDVGLRRNAGLLSFIGVANFCFQMFGFNVAPFFLH